MPVSIDHCWRRIGVAGDRQCPELARVGHCRNCSRFAEIAVRTLDRAPSRDCVEQATALLAREKDPEVRDTFAVIVFRLADEWLALPAPVFEEVTPLRPIRRIPHHTNGVLLGLVNVRGSLHLCVSMARLLGIAETEHAAQSRGGARLLVIGHDGCRWAFAADEVSGIHRVAPHELEDVPATAAKTAFVPAKAIFPWRQSHAGLLDDRRLFETLARSVP